MEIRYPKQVVVPIVVALLVFSGLTGPAFSDSQATAYQQAPPIRIVHEAKHILAHLKSTRYSHKTRIEESSGIYISDCSALVCHILGKAAPMALAAVTVDPGHRHARAKNFYDAFQNSAEKGAQKGWQRIPRLMDAKPGDIIAWRKDPMPSKGDTGHVVVAMETPLRESDGTVRVIVLDSSKRGHGSDTRQKGQSGVGLGVMWFRVDDRGAPVSIHWSSPKRKPKKVPIAIGRALSVLPES